MEIYKQILTLLDYGLDVIVKNENNSYQHFLPRKDEGGNYRNSGWYNSIERAKQYIGDYCGYSLEKLKEKSKDWEIVEYYRPEFKKFEVGDKVRILDSIEETSDWNNLKKYHPNMIGSIQNIYNCVAGLYYEVYNEDESDYCSIGAEYLAPPFEEEDEKVTIKISKKSLDALKESGIEIIK